MALKEICHVGENAKFPLKSVHNIMLLKEKFNMDSAWKFWFEGANVPLNPLLPYHCSIVCNVCNINNVRIPGCQDITGCASENGTKL